MLHVHLVVAFLVGGNWATATVAETLFPRRCQSNRTHVGWPNDEHECSHQTHRKAVADSFAYLRRNVMSFDLPRLAALGFPSEAFSAEEFHAVSFAEATRTLGRVAVVDADSVSLPDGLGDGIVNQTVYLALEAKADYPWTDAVPRHIFEEYVMGYASVDEARSNWRPLLHKVLRSKLLDLVNLGEEVTIEDVVHHVNYHLWSVLGRFDTETGKVNPIYFVAGQTPLIYDTMSVIAFGYGSCTGLAILFVNALRSCGVPARLVGTPAWNGDPEHGNHNWVEVYSVGGEGGDGSWSFLEPTPGMAEGGEEARVDDLSRNPCSRWFCKGNRFDGSTQVFAARLDKVSAGGVSYPMAWDVLNSDVPGENRTEYYTQVCGQC